MKDWEEYEKQIFEKLDAEFPDSDIAKNQKLDGIFSKRKRQIDILIKTSAIGKELKIVVDCKKFSKKIDVKTVESFIGFLEDVGAHLGILITNEGYTKSALRRVENYHRDIRLDIVKYEDLNDYHFSWDTCEACYTADKFRLSEINWSEPVLLEYKGLFQLIELGQCNYCGTEHIKCQGCGMILEIDDLEFKECMCGLEFSVESGPPGDDPTNFDVVIRGITDDYKEENFIDPNQLNLFNG